MSDHSLGGGFGENVRNDVQPQAEEIKKKERSKRKAGERLNTARWGGEGEDEEGRGRKKRGEWMRRKEEFRNSSGGGKRGGERETKGGGTWAKASLTTREARRGAKSGTGGGKATAAISSGTQPPLRPRTSTSCHHVPSTPFIRKSTRRSS